MNKKANMFKMVSLGILIIVGFIIYLATDQVYDNKVVPKQEYIVDRIVDGDTFVINNDTYRLLCVDFPDLDKVRIQKWLDMGLSMENVEKCYSDGISALKNTILKHNVTIQTDPDNLIDKYDRNLGYVYLGTTDIGLWLIQNGYAIQAYSPCIKESEYKFAEQQAREGKIGCLWSNFQVVTSV